MTDAVAPEMEYSLSFEFLDPAIEGALDYMVDNHKLASVLTSNVAALVPNARLWRMTVTGDVVRSVNAIEGRSTDESYTVDRGAGVVGGKTISHEDGTFDIVILADVLLYRQVTVK